MFSTPTTQKLCLRGLGGEYSSEDEGLCPPISKLQLSKGFSASCACLMLTVQGLIECGKFQNLET